LAAGRIRGLRKHDFPDRKDAGFTLDPEEL
jgi:hypothetical protein